MATPAQLRQMADEADAQAAQLAAQATVLRKQAVEFRRLAAAGDERLRSIYPKDTLGMKNMEARTPSPGAKKAWAKIQHYWPLQLALKRRGLSLPEWARAQRRPSLSVETAKAWLKKRGHGGNRCPEDWALRVAAEFIDPATGVSEVPAVDESWPCGIRWNPKPDA